MEVPKDNRAMLWKELVDYMRRHHEQAACAREMLCFLDSTRACFERSHAAGHFTGSACLLSPDGKKILLTLHRKLGRWLQPGGHADGDPQLLRVALREAQEESGIMGIIPMSSRIFDVDIHTIPSRPESGEGAHLHYDVRYLLRAPHEHFCISPESVELRWMDRNELLNPEFSVDESVRRLARKSAVLCC